MLGVDVRRVIICGEGQWAAEVVFRVVDGEAAVGELVGCGLEPDCINGGGDVADARDTCGLNERCVVRGFEADDADIQIVFKSGGLVGDTLYGGGDGPDVNKRVLAASPGRRSIRLQQSSEVLSRTRR